MVRLWIPDQVRDDDEKIGQHPVDAVEKVPLAVKRQS
jgi:hypothetical protein